MATACVGAITPAASASAFGAVGAGGVALDFGCTLITAFAAAFATAFAATGFTTALTAASVVATAGFAAARLATLA